jgi:lactate permease
LPPHGEYTTITARFHLERQRRQGWWQQVYDPMGSIVVSTLLAAVPVVVMLVALGPLHIKAHIAAGMGLVLAIAGAVFVCNMATWCVARPSLAA